MERALAETKRRRDKQIEFNATHGITPRGVVKPVVDVMEGARSEAPARTSGAAQGRVRWEPAWGRLHARADRQGNPAS